MPKWLVMLSGEVADLEDLIYYIPSSQLSVQSNGSDYYLRAAELDTLTDEDAVFSRAVDIVSLLRSMLKMYTARRAPIFVAAVIRDNKDGTFHVTQRFDLVRRVRGKRDEVSWQGTPVSRPTDAESWLNLARQDTNVQDALRFFEGETTWWNLRKSFEVIESELQPSKMDSLGFAPVSEILRFQKWAHHYVHGERKPVDQGRYPLLSLAEAEDFMYKLLVRWLRWKRDKQGRT